MVADILTQDQNFYNKTIVICNTDEELNEASFLFPQRSLSYITMPSSLSEIEVTAREAQWNNSRDGTYSGKWYVKLVFIYGRNWL